MIEVVEEVEHGELRNAPLPSRSAVVRGLVVFVMVCAAIPSVLGLLGRWGWLLDLCNHFRFQCAVVLLATTAGLLLLRSWKMGAVSVVGLAINLFFVLPLYLGSPGEAKAGEPTFTVMQFNVNTGNTNHAGVIAEIESHAPDLLFVLEVNKRWIDALKVGLTEYEIVTTSPRADNFGMACFARNKDKAFSIEGSNTIQSPVGTGSIPMIELSLRVNGQPLKVLGIHPLPPIRVDYASARDSLLAKAGLWAAIQNDSCIIVGDFNATPWSTAFRDLQSTGDLVNSQVGFGRAPTWPAGLGSLGMIPIDHLLHSEVFVTVDRTIGEANGSDHRPLIVELGLRK